jgi:hypothetical protein
MVPVISISPSPRLITTPTAAAKAVTLPKAARVFSMSSQIAIWAFKEVMPTVPSKANLMPSSAPKLVLNIVNTKAYLLEATRLTVR